MDRIDSAAANAKTTPATPASTTKSLAPRKLIKWLLILLLIAGAAIFGYRYWRQLQTFETTDNAYLNADTVEVAAQVTGPVIQVYVRDNQAVKAGDPLFDIDPAQFRVALEKAQAQLQIAEQNVMEQTAAVHAAEAQVAQRQAELRNARSNLARVEKLVAQRFMSPQSLEDTRTQMQTAAAAVDAAKASLEQARSALGESGNRNANVQAAQAAVSQAELDLSRTHVAAPSNGTVGNLTLRPGNTVQPGNPLFVIIQSAGFWVDANFKETQLESVRPGQTATIELDMYPNHEFHGVVESISSGAGTAFSLLPPQNATGNWVKVTQRVPVRVRFTDPDPRFPFRIGTTASVSVRVAE